MLDSGDIRLFISIAIQIDVQVLLKKRERSIIIRLGRNDAGPIVRFDRGLVLQRAGGGFIPRLFENVAINTTPDTFIDAVPIHRDDVGLAAAIFDTLCEVIHHQITRQNQLGSVMALVTGVVRFFECASDHGDVDQQTVVLLFPCRAFFKQLVRHVIANAVSAGKLLPIRVITVHPISDQIPTRHDGGVSTGMEL